MEAVKATEYKVLLGGGEGEIVEKKSRFIATVRRCDSEQEAMAFIEEMKKKYWDARHNCYAFVIGAGGELTRCSDDGEPGGTAGRPILEVLLGEELCNVAVVVTRYFGGVLLGTGGLVRAYTQAVKAGLSACETGYMRLGTEAEIVTDYHCLGRVQALLAEREITPLECLYTDTVLLRILFPAGKEDTLQRELADATNGKVNFTKRNMRYYIDKG